MIVPLKFAGSRCAFAARGLSAETTIDSSPIVFENVISTSAMATTLQQVNTKCMLVNL